MKCRICIALPILGTLLVLALASVPTALSYPWIRYFEPQIHFAYPDSEGNIITASGDFHIFYMGRQRYRFSGVYSIDGPDMAEIECPDWIYVVDGTMDQDDRLWLLIGTWREDERYPYPPIEWVGGTVPGKVGYHEHIYPWGWWGSLEDYRLALLDGDRLVEYPEVTDRIPGQMGLLSSNGRGRFLVLSCETYGEVLRTFISWWRIGHGESPQVVRLDTVCPLGDECFVVNYPAFGPDGLAYFLVGVGDDGWGSTDELVLCLDLEAQKWDVFDDKDSPFLDCGIKYFKVDDNNVKWFGTEDGLVAFDGQNWSRFTTENSDLPYNLVRQIEYDEIDDVYYVISQSYDSEADSHPAAFSIFSSSGTSLGDPFEIPHSTDLWIPQLQRAGDVWFLTPCPFRNDTTYTYDHYQVREWHLREWTQAEGDIWDYYVGSSSDGRTFLVTGTCVMIW